MGRNTLVRLLLVALVVFDVTLAVSGYVFQDRWFSFFHGAPYVDPQAYLPRAAGNWTMFAVLQFVALLRWEGHPVWLAMVSAVRLSDGLTDWSVLAFSQDLTTWGAVSFALAGVGNFALGWFFWDSWKKFAPGHSQQAR